MELTQPSAVAVKISLSIAASALTLLIAACFNQGGTPAGSQEVTRIVTLDQGWDANARLAFATTSQGSQIIPYSWFLALERAGDGELLRSEQNIQRWGYLPAEPEPDGSNPDGLPVGFVKAVGRNRDEWIGLTCAACHTTQLNYKGVGLRIDGGPAMADFDLFFRELVEALTATLNDDAKFDRFALRVLGNSSTTAQREQLRASLAEIQGRHLARYLVNKPDYEAGYARVDAFGNIFNEILVFALDQPGNAKPNNAPVSYPFLWDTSQHDRVQWNGSSSNDVLGLGQLARNTGEVLGVFGNPHIVGCGPDTCTYRNNVDFVGIGKLEPLLFNLWSPPWDSRYLGAIDAAGAARGKVHYEKYCADCHALINRSDPLRKVTAVMRDVGTDPGTATAYLTRSGTTGPLQGRIKSQIPLVRFGATDTGVALLANAVKGVLYENPSVSADSSMVQPRLSEQPVEDTSITRHATYKARPLNGIWATAPYLHNGSVPTLWQLLQEPDQRIKTFNVGNREFDPKDVGFESASGPYLFDCELPGNSNEGHAFGTKELTNEQKRDLIEYLKTL